MAKEELTPMQRQYQEMKARNKDCILFFRLGDFYEMFNEDAKLAARELDLTLTSRDRSKPKEEQTPMCGVPYHSVDAYIARLVQKGYKVAICEQMEDPALAKGLVERDITRIITPGTVTESCMLEESKNNYMGCVFGQSGQFGLAFCDLSTGAFFATTCSDPRAVASELGRFTPSEVLRFGQGVEDEAISDVLFRRLSCCVDEGKAEDFDFEKACTCLESHFGRSVEELGLASAPDTPIIAVISRLSNQKGLDLIDRVIGEIMEEDVQLAVLGMGDARYVNLFSWAEQRYPGRVAARFRMDGALAKRIYAGADIFLMPSQFEPCGLSQMIALRYGTLPVVRETGGLRDTVLSYNEANGAGNGFTFFNYNAHDMLFTIRRALYFYRQDKPVWHMLQHRAMTGDYSWEHSAQVYLSLYQDMARDLKRPEAAEEKKPAAGRNAPKPRARKAKADAAPAGSNEKKPRARKPKRAE